MWIFRFPWRGQAGERRCTRWTTGPGSNPSGKFSQEWLTRVTVTYTMRRAAHSSGCARCGAIAGSSAIKYQSLSDWSGQGLSWDGDQTGQDTRETQDTEAGRSNSDGPISPEAGLPFPGGPVETGRQTDGGRPC